MRKIFIGFILLITSQVIFCQDKNDIGIFPAVTYYQGDLNPQKMFSSPNVYFGGFIRMNLNELFAIKTDIGYFGLSGSNVGTFTPGSNNDYSFSTQNINASIKFEINFFKYSDIKMNVAHVSPYLTVGIAGLFDFKNIYPSIPFGGGVKFKVSDRITAGAEWLYHKTFTDKIDGVLNGYDNLNNTNNNTKSTFNNDWYSFFGFHVSYKMKGTSKKCATYSNQQ